MNGPMLGLCGILAMLAALFLLRFPAAFAMAIAGFVGFALATNASAALYMAESELWGVFSNYGFTVIPMFILLGEIIYHAGYSDRLYSSTYKWFGHWRGGQAITTILASAGFSAICGSNTATAATMCAVAIPSMKKYNYHPALSTGAVAAGSTLGVMIPPSIVLVVYGLDRGQSIGKLFFGAIVPSAILTLLMGLTISAICWRHPDWGPKGERRSWMERLRAAPGVLDIFILFAVIMAALFTGKVTPTEAASTSCALGLILCAIRRKLTWAKLRDALYDTLRISCMIFMIVAGAVVFGRFMTITRLPYEVAAWIGALNWPGWIILLMMLLCYIIGGCIMDALAFLLISLPIFYPIAEALGYDPIWFGVVICVVTTLGAITPPIGICCFIIAGRAKDVPVEVVFKGAMFYVPAYILTIAILMLRPYETVVWLSSWVR